MRTRSRDIAALAALASALAGCDTRDTAVARAAGAHGSSIELPVPAPASSATPTPVVAAGAGAGMVTIGFPQGGAVLDPAARSDLDRLAADPRVRGAHLILRGHSDSDGDDAGNRRMSRQRADAVRDYLAGKGVARAAMQVIALGEARPIAPNARPDGSDDSAGRARNRRVEIDLAPAA